MGLADSTTAGLRDAAQNVLSTLVDIGRGRLELVSVELEEERLRIARLWIAATCTLFFAFVGLVLLSALIVMLFDPAQRLAALGVITALFLAAGAAGAWRWHRLSSRKQPLLHATVGELRKDREALRAAADA